MVDGSGIIEFPTVVTRRNLALVPTVAVAQPAQELWVMHGFALLRPVWKLLTFSEAFNEKK